MTLRVLACLASAACLTGGITSLVLARSSKHENAVEAYEQAVEKWSSHRRPFDSIASIELRVSSDGFSSSSDAVLSRATSNDPFFGSEEDPDLPHYKATYFSAGPADANASSGSGGMPDDFLPSTSFTELGVVLGDGMTRWGEVANFSLHLQGGEEILLEPVPLVRAVAHWEPEGLYDHCSDEGGVHEKGGKCWFYQRLSNICVQVAKSSSGSWELAPRQAGNSGSYGCKLTDGAWEAATYKTLPPEGFKPHKALFEIDWEALENRSVSFDDFRAEVRSSYDPYFAAMELTGGSMTFGWTSAEEDILGIVLIVLGAVLGFHPCFLLCRAWRREGRGARGAGRTAGDEEWRISRVPSWRRRREARGKANPEVVGIRNDADAGEGRASCGETAC